jgi:ribose 5-phosphate isomerase A
MVVGLGTGSTARFAVEGIARKLDQGELERVVGVPTSVQTRDHAASVGIPLTTLQEHPRLDLTIDGADEIDPAGNLIKGGGGALLWEKIVATASARLLIVADAGKLVDRLGRAFPLPIEVVTFGWSTHEQAIRDVGAEPVLRRGADGTPVRTDEGHYLLDCRFEHGIADVDAVNLALRQRPGVVETGLFLHMDPEVFVGRSGT